MKFHPHSSRRTAVIAALAVAVVTSFWGCAASSLVNMWRDPTYSSPPMKKMLVIAIRKDATRRRTWEDEFCAALVARGVAAMPSYLLYPNAMPDSSQIDAAIQEADYDGVIMTRRLTPQVRERYVPGYVTTEPETHYNRWRKAYVTTYRQVEQPGYTETDKIIRHEVLVYNVAGEGRLVWSGTTNSTDQSSQGSLRKEVAGIIVPELAKQGLIAAK